MLKMEKLRARYIIGRAENGFVLNVEEDKAGCPDKNIFIAKDLDVVNKLIKSDMEKKIRYEDRKDTDV